MGGGSYDGDVAQRRREVISTTGTSHFQYEQQQKKKTVAERKCHADLDPKGKNRECRDNEDHPDTTPIVAAMDFTQSRGQDANTIFVKMPMFIGQIYMNGYVPDPALCPVGIGDATCDRASLQVGQFESDNRIDDDLGKIWREEGGGGTGEESYELAAYYFSRHAEMDILTRGKKGYFFFIGDESPYRKVNAQEVERIFGDKLKQNIPTAEVMRQLQEKFHVYLIYPQRNWEKHKEDIDKEIKKRVQEAGGMYDNVDVRFSLLWHDYNDLDLHVVDPKGNEIYYANKCGILDIDRNAGGPETRKPVENCRWPKDEAPKGTYRVFVRRYAYHEGKRTATPFKVEICIGGKIQHFEGEVPVGLTGSESDIEVGEFFFDPKAEKQEQPDKYSKYQKEAVIKEWRKYLPEENILAINDSEGILDIMLGVLAIQGGTRDLDGYIVDLVNKGQSDARIADVTQALNTLAQAVSIEPINIPTTVESKPTRRRSRRI